MIISISGKIGSGKDTVANMLQYHLSSNPGNEGTFKQYNYLYNEIGTGIHKPEWEIKRFADKLKDITCLLIGCSREQLEDREFKEKPLGEDWWYYRAISFGSPQDVKMFPYTDGNSEKRCDEYIARNETSGHIYNMNLIKLTPRKIMQLLGTECGREIIHPNIWVNSLFADYISSPNKHSTTQWKGSNWIIPDTRFPNEANAIKDKNGLLIRVNRPIEMGMVESDGNKAEFKQHPSETALDDYDDWDYIIENNESLEHLFNKVKIIVENI